MEKQRNRLRREKKGLFFRSPVRSILQPFQPSRYTNRRQHKVIKQTNVKHRWMEYTETQTEIFQDSEDSLVKLLIKLWQKRNKENHSTAETLEEVGLPQCQSHWKTGECKQCSTKIEEQERIWLMFTAWLQKAKEFKEEVNMCFTDYRKDMADHIKWWNLKKQVCLSISLL